MKIAFIGTRGIPASYSGFETCVEQVASRMVARGHDVTVYCRRSHYRQRPPNLGGIKLRYIPAVKQKHLETLSHSFFSGLQLEHDAIPVCMGVGNAPVVRLLEAQGRRSVFNVDGADWQRAKWGRFAGWYLRRSEAMAARSQSILVADSRAVQEHYMATYGRSSEFIPYGAVPPDDHGTETLERLGLQAKDYVLFVGRLVPENAPHDVIEAVAGLDPSIRLVIVGDASYQGTYISQLRERASPWVVFTGYQFGRAYQQLSANARLFVLAARVGGTHPVLLEQMAAGNCVLARDTDSNREVVGDSGIMWHSIEDLREAIRRTWSDNDLRAELGARARAKVAAAYDWEAVTDRYLECCRATAS